MNYDELKAQFLAALPAYLGNGNLLSQKNLDQGDTLQRVSTIFTLLGLIDDSDLSTKVVFRIRHPSFDSSMQALSPFPGILRRSPDSSYWGYSPWCTSRDQLSIAKQAMLVRNDWQKLLCVFSMQSLRLGLHQNVRSGTDGNKWQFPDVPSWNEVSVYLRGFLGLLSMIPNLCLDWLFFSDIYFRKNDLYGSDNMLAQNLLVACHKFPTIGARQAMQAYLKTDFMLRLWQYHGRGNDCLPLYYLYRMAFLKLESYDPGSLAP